jgi:hypothetical protein
MTARRASASRSRPSISIASSYLFSDGGNTVAAAVAADVAVIAADDTDSTPIHVD